MAAVTICSDLGAPKNKVWHCFPIYHQLRSLFKIVSIESVMSSNHLILYQPILLLPSNFLSIRVFSNDSVLCIMRPKYWHFSFSISLSNEYSGLISFRMDWFYLLAVQRTLKSLLQHQQKNLNWVNIERKFWSKTHCPGGVHGGKSTIQVWTLTCFWTSSLWF